MTLLPRQDAAQPADPSQPDANKPDPNPGNSNNTGGGGGDSSNHAWAWFILALFVVVVLVLVVWFVYSHVRARRLGLPPPSLVPFRSNNRVSARSGASKNPLSWLSGKVSSWRTGRRPRGHAAYETSRSGRAMDPDEAWDTRLDHEADGYGPYGGYDEQELGLRSHHARQDSDLSYSGPHRTGYGPTTGLEEISEQRGRSPQRELDERYDEAMGAKGRNPFGDDAARDRDPFSDHAERSNMPLRGLSPRPHEDEGRPRAKDHAERRSIFHEQV